MWLKYVANLPPSKSPVSRAALSTLLAPQTGHQDYQRTASVKPIFVLSMLYTPKSQLKTVHACVISL